MRKDRRRPTGHTIKVIGISLTKELLEQIDQHAGALYASRSEYIRHTVIEQLRVDSQNDNLRKTMLKQLPNKYIKKGTTDEFDISDDYI